MADVLTKAILSNIISKTDKYDAAQNTKDETNKEIECIGNLDNKEVQVLKSLMNKKESSAKIIRKQQKISLGEFVQKVKN
ncbi:MAG: hypothetical protein COA82_02515 [Alkaliphilus sp.]|nr:hypothetical protein [bacterium AH-315-L21]MBN4069341.1 hypothetical protein [bacterium AH-315-G05]PHS35914.1 MAG: hypothetical protein COA82_02515 [Alkaliphilus sp.]